MTLTYFRTMSSTWVTYAFEWVKLLKCHFKGKTCRKSANGQNINYSDKIDLMAIFNNIRTYSRSQVIVNRTIGPLFFLSIQGQWVNVIYKLNVKFNFLRKSIKAKLQVGHP